MLIWNSPLYPGVIARAGSAAGILLVQTQEGLCVAVSLTMELVLLCCSRHLGDHQANARFTSKGNVILIIHGAGGGLCGFKEIYG